MKLFRKHTNTLKTKEEKGKNAYCYVTEFKDGYALAIRKPAASHERDVVIIDENYNTIGKTEYAHTTVISMIEHEVIFCAYSDNEVPRKKGLLDKNLNVLLPLEYDEIVLLPEGRKLCAIKDDTSNIFDIRKGMLIATNIGGKIVWLEKYNGENYYKFEMNGKYGYYKENNEFFKVAVEAEYDTLYSIDEEGRIPFEQNGKIGVFYLEIGMKSFRD